MAGWAALIAAAASIVVAVLSGIVALRAQNKADRLERFRADATQDLELLKSELQRRIDREKRELEAEAVLARYRDPLTAAAYDLQSRLYNILQQGFLTAYGGEGNERQEDAIKSTLFRLAQYFGWTEILRQDISAWKFAQDEDTRAVGELLAAVQGSFQTDAFPTEFMIWRDEQRAIGEMMIVEESGPKTCVGYARFVELYDDRMRRWLERIERNLRAGAGSNDYRLSRIQNDLVNLVQKLDPKQLRYVHYEMERSHVAFPTSWEFSGSPRIG